MRCFAFEGGIVHASRVHRQQHELSVFGIVIAIVDDTSTD
jgi:hypothetical protein